MYIKKIIKINETDESFGLFSVITDKGIFDGKTDYQVQIENNKITYTAENEFIKLVSEFNLIETGGCLRKDYLINLTDEDVHIKQMFSRFNLEGGEYEVYTESNSWENESIGRWSTLSNTITSENQGIRTTDGATPIMALYNKLNSNITVFDLFPNGLWKFKATRRAHVWQKETITVDIGLNDSLLDFVVYGNETIDFPQIFFYETKDKVSLGSEVLHKYFSKEYPRKQLPVVYNTWLMCFDFLDYDNLINQAKTASELGMEYFVIDAGWYDKYGKTCLDAVGDFVEDKENAFKGRMKEFSIFCKQIGLKFGLWLEIERTCDGTESFKNYKDDYFSPIHFTDFSKENVVERISKKVNDLIKEYDIKFIKFDFNRTIAHDYTGSAFYRYFKGQRKFIENLRKANDDLYLCNCSSGGFRIDLNQATYYDSFWLSDDQSPIDGIRMLKDMGKRIHPSTIERWSVEMPIKNVIGYSSDYLSLVKNEKMISCNNATWTSLINVSDSYKTGFQEGGIPGFSSNIYDFPIDYKEKIKNFISEYKERRNYYINANVRTLIDSENFIVFEYFDNSYNEIELKLFTNKNNQNELTVYPLLDENSKYLVDGKIIDGKNLVEDGYTFKDFYIYNSIKVKISKII